MSQNSGTILTDASSFEDQFAHHPTFMLNFNMSYLWCSGILASGNIAVFLFEIASPVRSNDLELFSLPLLYGAKINDLIMVGEWWRLITPMFLVQH